MTTPDPDVEVELLPHVPVASAGCEGGGEAMAAPVAHPFELDHRAGAFERLGHKVDLRPLPTL